MTGEVIRAYLLCRRFGWQPALRDVTLSIGPGRIVALLGPNGAGKTTFLKLIAGLIEPTEGEAWVFGEPARSPSPETARQVIAALDGHHPPAGATPIQLARLQSDATPGFDQRKFQQLLESRGLTMTKPYGALSKGQKRWVLSSLVLSTGSRLLLLDEPADGLDPEARRELYDLLRDVVTATEATTVVATHILADVERVADDVALIRKGELLLHASLEDLREEVREVEFRPPVDGWQWGDGVVVLDETKEGDWARAWIRAKTEKLEELAGQPHVTLRPVPLDDLYIALMRSNQPMESEAAS